MSIIKVDYGEVGGGGGGLPQGTWNINGCDDYTTTNINETGTTFPVSKSSIAGLVFTYRVKPTDTTLSITTVRVVNLTKIKADGSIENKSILGSSSPKTETITGYDLIVLTTMSGGANNYTFDVT